MRQIHGGDIHAYERTYGEMPIDFSANVNPLGMPQGASEAAREALEKAEHYPDPSCTALRDAIAEKEGVLASQVLCGNGAADLIYRFAYAVRPQAALVCTPAFAEYAAAFDAAGATVRTHPLLETDGFRVTDTLLNALDGVQALCLCTPNNPTGLTIDQGLLACILAKCGQYGISVLLDECFVDFLDDPQAHTSVAALAQNPNLVILKAFTKFYAMPGLRLGYALSTNGTLLRRMDAAGAPWSVSNVAQAAGIAALSDRSHAMQTHRMIRPERAFMRQMLRQMGYSPMGEANFLLFYGAPGLAASLAENGVLVRDCLSFAGLDEGWIRIAIRSRAENIQLLSRLLRCQHG